MNNTFLVYGMLAFVIVASMVSSFLHLSNADLVLYSIPAVLGFVVGHQIASPTQQATINNLLQKVPNSAVVTVTTPESGVLPNG